MCLYPIAMRMDGGDFNPGWLLLSNLKCWTIFSCKQLPTFPSGNQKVERKGNIPSGNTYYPWCSSLLTSKQSQVGGIETNHWLLRALIVYFNTTRYLSSCSFWRMPFNNYAPSQTSHILSITNETWRSGGLMDFINTAHFCGRMYMHLPEIWKT